VVTAKTYAAFPRQTIFISHSYHRATKEISSAKHRLLKIKKSETVTRRTFAVTGRLHFINVQMDDAVQLRNGDAVSDNIIYLCIVFNQFLRNTANGDDQRILPLVRPRKYLIAC
jgi:hypothetical protein